MIRFILVCWLMAFCWIQSVDSTNDFIKNLLTTTPSSSHISDFRTQKRTDSRADKPDQFPGFDLHLDSTTPSPRKRRRQAYSKLIRLFLQNTRDRLDTIRDVIKDEGELHLRLTPRPADEVADDTNAAIRFTDEENRQFIDAAFADATSSDEATKFQMDDKDNAAQTYLNSLFSAVGYTRITTTPNPIDETNEGGIVARYLLNPLLSTWNSLGARFNSNNDSAENDGSESPTSVYRVNFFDNRNDSSVKMHTARTNKESNETRVDNFNYSLPLIQLTTNNVTNVMLTNETTTELTFQANVNTVNVSQMQRDVEHIGVDHVDSDKKPRNTIRSTVEDAATAFRNAFFKYSNNMQNSMENANSATLKFTQDNSHEMKNDKLLDATLFAGNLFDSNSTHIQVVPGKKLKANGSMSESTTMANNIDDITEPNAKSFSENAGILILEIFGTVIGTTWHALSGIPNYFNAPNRDENDEAF